MKIICQCLIASFYILRCIYGRTDDDNIWLGNLVTILKTETKTNQVLLLYDDDFNNSGIAPNIFRSLPTKIANFRNIISNCDRQWMTKSTTTVLISIDNGNNLSKVENVLNCVAELSSPRTRPKVLIIAKMVKTGRYQKFFQQMWSKKFLDLTILEIREKSKIVSLQHYNPFMKIRIVKPFSNGSILFPDKLHNLNGYLMKVGVFHYPPYISIDRNSTGHVSKIQGPDINWVIVMSEYLNFRVEMVISNASNWDSIDCDRSKNVGLFNKTIHSEIQLIAVQGALYETCFNTFVAISKGTKMFRFVALAPILPIEDAIFRNEWRLLNIMFVLSFFLMPVLLAKYLKFDPQYWTMMYSVQMVLGFSTPKMPVKTIERIMLLAMLFFYILQSSYIFTSLSEMQLQKMSFRKMETFRDLLEANLRMVTHGNTTEEGGFDHNDAYQEMITNAILSDGTVQSWVEFLIAYKNITYVCREEMALLSLQTSRDDDGQPKVKIIEEISGMWPGGIYLEEGSPYKGRFDAVMSVLVQAGLTNKWDADYISKSIAPQNLADLFHQESSLTSKVGKLMIASLFLGYSCSFLVFAAEILIHKYYK